MGSSDVLMRRIDSMKHRLSLCVALVAMTWLPMPVTYAQTGLPDACSVMSPAELTTILGRKDFGKPRPEKGPGDGESVCRFPGRVQSGVSIALSPTTKLTFDEFRKLLVEQGEKPEAVTGVGDAAYFWHPGRIYVLTGRTMLTVSFSNETSVNDKMKQDLVALARAVMPKLKG
jgi:hypothetical protein